MKGKVKNRHDNGTGAAAGDEESASRCPVLANGASSATISLTHPLTATLTSPPDTALKV